MCHDARRLSSYRDQPCGLLAGGATANEIAADFPYIIEDDVRAVLAYAAGLSDHPIIIAAE